MHRGNDIYLLVFPEFPIDSASNLPADFP